MVVCIKHAIAKNIDPAIIHATRYPSTADQFKIRMAGYNASMSTWIAHSNTKTTHLVTTHAKSRVPFHIGTNT